MTNFQKSVAILASQGPPIFEREDWSLFRTFEGLQQRAGVPKRLLARLVLREVADNGLDSGAKVKIKSENGGYVVEDDGKGIDGSPEEIARLFSIGRPMVSTKLLRLPTRGALGNGLRVVAGAVLASEGSLVVITRNRRIVLRPERDGSTTVVSVEDDQASRSAPVSRSASVPRFRAIRILCPGHGSPAAWRSLGPSISASPPRGGTTPRNSMNCYMQAATGRCAI